jgi:cobyrinic acid a,c-diamide synthase
MGYQVQPFKHGPDFIDPGYHRLALGRDSINLDFWMMGKQQIIQSFNDYMQNTDIGIGEAMGALFDGKNGTEEGSAADLALTLFLPTILVVDVYGMTRSVNALLQGFLDFDPHLKISGIIFNRAGSQKHYEMIFDSLRPRFRSLSLGCLPRFSHLNIPENFARQLAENDGMKFQILRCAQRGMPIYAECGGLIYVCKKLLFWKAFIQRMYWLATCICIFHQNKKSVTTLCFNVKNINRRSMFTQRLSIQTFGND